MMGENGEGVYSHRAGEGNQLGVLGDRQEAGGLLSAAPPCTGTHQGP